MSFTIAFTPFHSRTVDPFSTRHRVVVWRVVEGRVLTMLHGLPGLIAFG